MVCESCGQPLTNGTKFCGLCGAASAPSFAFDGGLPLVDGPVGPPQAHASVVASSGDVPVVAFLIGMLVYAVVVFAIYRRVVHDDWAMALGWTIGGAFLWPAVGVGIARLFGARRWRRNLLIWVPIVAVLAFFGAWPRHHVSYSAADVQSIHDAVSELHAVADENKQLAAGQKAAMTEMPNRLDQLAAAPHGPVPPALASIIHQEAALLRAFGERSAAHGAQLDALHIETVLAPASLAHASSIDEGRDRLHQASAIEHAVFQDYRETMDSIQSLLNTLPEEARASAIAGFRASRPRGDAAMTRLMHVEEQIYARGEDMLDLGEANLGKSYARNNTIYLPHDALPRYNELIHDIRELAQEETQAQKDLAALQQEGLRDIESVENFSDAR